MRNEASEKARIKKRMRDAKWHYHDKGEAMGKDLTTHQKDSLNDFWDFLIDQLQQAGYIKTTEVKTTGNQSNSNT